MRESAIYRELNTKKVGDAPSSDIDLISKDVHLQQSNQTELLELDLINRVTFRDGGPIPGTETVFSVDVTSDAKTVFWVPNDGEAWRIQAISTTTDSTPSGNIGYYLYLRGIDQNGDEKETLVGSTTSSLLTTNQENLIANLSPLYVFKNMFAVVDVSTMAGTSSIEFKVSAYRVR
jgi:hypothetical protein